MLSLRTICLALATVILLPAASFGDPPSHAPAHGRRSQEQNARHEQPSGGVKVVFDSAQGIHVAIDLPGVYFHSGAYYRHTDGGWQVSATGKGSWGVAGALSIPEVIRVKHPSPPAKVKSHTGSKNHGAKKRK